MSHLQMMVSDEGWKVAPVGPGVGENIYRYVKSLICGKKTLTAMTLSVAGLFSTGLLTKTDAMAMAQKFEGLPLFITNLYKLGFKNAWHKMLVTDTTCAQEKSSLERTCDVSYDENDYATVTNPTVFSSIYNLELMKPVHHAFAPKPCAEQEKYYNDMCVTPLAPVNEFIESTVIMGVITLPTLTLGLRYILEQWCKDVEEAPAAPAPAVPAPAPAAITQNVRLTNAEKVIRDKAINNFATTAERRRHVKKLREILQKYNIPNTLHNGGRLTQVQKLLKDNSVP